MSTARDTKSSDGRKRGLGSPGRVLDDTSRSILACAHFSTTPPTEERRAYYQKESGSDALMVRQLERDDAFMKEFNWRLHWLTTHISCGVEFAFYGKETMIRRETRHIRRDSRWWNWYSNPIVPDVKACIDHGPSKFSIRTSLGCGA